MSFGGLFSTIGDPTTFVSRDESQLRAVRQRARRSRRPSPQVRRLPVPPGRSIPVNPQAARGAFTFNGQWTGNAFADFLLGYPSAAQVGIGRADEHGRSTWLHVYGQDDWRVASNLTINYGLRYEINGQMNDVDNRLSAIDLSVPGGRFVIASDDNGQDLADRAGAAAADSDSVRHVEGRRLDGRRCCVRAICASRRALGLAWASRASADTVITAGFGVFLNQWAYSVQQALAQTLPFFFAKTVNAAADAVQPAYTTEQHAAGARQRHASAATR